MPWASMYSPTHAVGVVLLHVRDDGLAVEALVELLGDGALAGLIAAAVADEDDVLEAVHLQAVRDVGEHARGRCLRAG